MRIGDRIKLKRKEKRLKQTELAKMVNVSSQVISNWERGYTDPSHDDVARLAKALNCTTNYLHGIEESDVAARLPLTEKENRDVAKRMDKLKKDLIEGNADGDGLNYRGEPMSPEAIESLLEALEHAERIATLANRKFTPKKYRKEE